MKGSRLYMIFLGLFLVLVFLFEYMSPHRFSWKPTFDKNDKEPFGSYVFDDVVSSSVDRYTVTDRTFYQLMQEDSTASPQAFLLTENYFYLNDTDIECLYKLIHTGNQVMICMDNFPYTLEDTLCFETAYDYYFPSIEHYIRDERKRDSLFFGTDTLHPEYIYEVYPQIHPVYLITGKNKWVHDRPDNDSTEVVDDTLSTVIREEIDSLITVVENTEEEATGTTSGDQFFPINCDSIEILVWDNENKPLVIRAFIGKGELFLVSTPLMFTNYGILDGDNASYVFRLLSYMKNRPLTRIEAYGAHSEKARTPLRYVLSEPPLRWAVYSMLVLLILFMTFTAKRRQRIIPVIRTPANRTFEFMQLISNLYYQKHENGEILKMKHLYFCAEVKRLIGVDLQDGIPDETTYLRLSEKTGKDRDVLRSLIKNIEMGIYRSNVSDMQLKEYIDGMNDILRILKS
ncbi:MAG: hypothetical protein LBF05_01230 [Tannerella sp.]|jgi:hypothetical protein|nr:hypothetical protein [Tannerella sp.]